MGLPRAKANEPGTSETGEKLGKNPVSSEAESLILGTRSVSYGARAE